jgi:hypothetical protein
MSFERVIARGSTHVLPVQEGGMNRYVTVMAMVVAAVALGACDRGATSPKGAVDARYELQSISGTSLPYTQTLGSATLRITGDVLLLHRDGTYEDSTTYAIPYGAAVQQSTTIERGKYSISDGTIAFNDQTNGGRYSGTIVGTTLTQSVNGLTPVYERR